MDAVQTSVLSVIALIVCFSASLLVCCCCARIWGSRRYQPTPAAELNRPMYTGGALPGRAERLQQSFGRFSASIRRKFRRQRSINRTLMGSNEGDTTANNGLTLNPSVYLRMETGRDNYAFESNFYAEEELPAWYSANPSNGVSNGLFNGHAGGQPPLQQQVQQPQQMQQLARNGRRDRRHTESAV